MKQNPEIGDVPCHFDHQGFFAWNFHGSPSKSGGMYPLVNIQKANWKITE